MAYNPAIHHRRSLRIPGYDYSQNGAYFITVCTHNHKCIFGNIVDGEMQLNGFGEIAWEYINTIPEHFVYIDLGEIIIMPNHVHGIIIINETNSECNGVGVQHAAPLLSTIVRSYKSSVTNQINKIRNTPKSPVWQRNYWEHIIRDEKSFDEISTYIINNPGKWQFDKLFQSDP